MKKILVNTSFGGFGLKDEYYDYFMKRTQGLDDIREDEKLIALVEQGVDIGDNYAEIGVAEIPDLQNKLIRLAKGGFKHHTTVANGHVKAILEEAFKYYLNYDVVSIEG